MTTGAGGTRRSSTTGRLILLCAFLCAGMARLDAQDVSISVRVKTADGTPIPFANVAIQARATRIANADGTVEYSIPRADSAMISARRIGYKPFSGWVAAGDSGQYAVILEPLPTQIAAVTVADRQDTPLARRGFYDRIERVRRGAFSARFFTPEELEQRNPSRVSQLLQGENMIRVDRDQRGRAVLLGRGPRCAMTVLVDGQRMTGTLEDAINNPQMNRDRTNLIAVDDLVPAASIAAVEVYGSVAAAPAELLQVAGGIGCGIVAIWTGSRR
jgi:hypothetical protein